MDDSNFDMENYSSLVDVDSCWNELLLKFCITVRPSMLESKVQLARTMKKCNNGRANSESVMQLTAFTAFETGRKLNSVCCNYVNFSHQPLFLSLKREVFPSLLSKDSHTMHRFIIFMRTNQDQIFDGDINYQCYVKNLLRFFNNNIAREMIDNSRNFAMLDCWKSWLFKNETKYNER